MTGRTTSMTTASDTVAQYWEQLSGRAQQLWRGDDGDAAPAHVTVMPLPHEPGYAAALADMTTLSYTQRLTTFALVLGMGLVFIAIAALLAPTIALAPRKFAFFLSVGNVLCLCSTMFLVGARTQLQCMLQAKRLHAACVYAAAVALTLYCAIHLRSSIGSVVFAVVQVGALLWYVLSFVPFARQTVAYALGSLRSFCRLFV